MPSLSILLFLSRLLGCTMGELTSKLVDELGSLIDEPTILSICSDYDLTNPQEFAAARDVLLSISQTVEAEEATGFNPSGLGANGVIDINTPSQNEFGDARNVAEIDLKSNHGLTMATERSQPLSHGSSNSSKTSIQETPELFRVDVFDTLSEEGKEAALAEMFTSLKLLDVKFALKKAKGDASLALDELLNTELLEQTGQRLKGIDGFFRPDETVPSKKRKGKKKNGISRNSGSGNSSLVNVSEKSGKSEEVNPENVSYLAERLRLPEPEVLDIYQRRGGSKGTTVVEVLDNYLALGITPGQTQLPDANDVVKKYSWIPSRYIVAIFEITSPSRQFAFDLIRVLADYFEKPAYLKYDVSYNITAPYTDDELLSENGTTGVSLSGGKWTTVINGKSKGLGQPVSLQSIPLPSKDLAAARDHSFATATSAFRKGQSDPLFRQAAAFYGQRATEQMQSYRQAVSTEVEYLINMNSTDDKIDLHGATVQDAVNMSLRRVRRWWDSLGEDKPKRAKEGFTIITGRGLHNRDGRSRLRSSVCKALVAEGWKVEVLTGSYVITGRRR